MILVGLIPYQPHHLTIRTFISEVGLLVVTLSMCGHVDIVSSGHVDAGPRGKSNKNSKGVTGEEGRTRMPGSMFEPYGKDTLESGRALSKGTAYCTSALRLGTGGVVGCICGTISLTVGPN